MLQSLRNFRIYQDLVSKCIQQNNGLTLAHENTEDLLAIIAKKRADIRKRHEEITKRMNSITEQSRALLQK